MFKLSLQKLTKRQKLKLAGGFWLFIVGIIFILITLREPFFSFQLSLSDKLSISNMSSPNIIIVAIDDESLNAYGRFGQWSRNLHAKAIENLEKAGARVIGFDILFADQSTEDEELARANGKYDNIVLSIAGVSPVFQEGSAMIVFDRFILPATVFLKESSHLGHANVSPDRDSIVRRLPLFASDIKQVEYPSIEMSVLSRFFKIELPRTAVVKDGYLDLLGRRVPVDSKMNMRINYISGKQTFRRISYKDILENNFNPDLVKNKIILIGITATAESDFWTTPIASQKMPGVEIHAQAIDTLLRNRFLAEIDRSREIQILALMTIIMAVSLPLLSLSWGLLLTILLFAGYLALAFVAFDRGTVMNLLYPPGLLLVVFGGNLAYNAVMERALRKEVRDLFGRYVSPEITREIINLSNKGTLGLGGQLRTVTVMFTDARGFTSKAEGLSPHELVEALNKHMEPIINKVTENGGIVNKFAGDNIMAIWNAPSDHSNHALQAAKAAFESVKALKEMWEEFPDLHRFEFGFGINTGEVLAGNMGAHKRMEYTVIGDAVNLASRICSDAAGSEVLLGEKTYEMVQKEVVAEPLGPRMFKGKSEPVNVYRLKGLTNTSSIP